MAISFLVWSTLIAGSPGLLGADEPAEETAPSIRRRAISTDLGRSIFSGFSPAVEPEEALERSIRERILAVDRICRLTADQKQKLLLAGRRDHEQFLERVADLERRYQLARQDERQALSKEGTALRRELEPEYVDDDSLFAKVLANSLTPEQSGRVEAHRLVARLDGRFTVRGGSIPFGASDLPINLAGTRVTDADLETLKGLPELSALDLQRTGIGDAGLAHLRALTAMRSLNLAETRITDDGLANLEGMKGLFSLDLRKTAVTDAGLSRLDGLRGVHSLDLSETQVTDATIEGLKSRRLSRLSLKRTKVTGATLAQLQGSMLETLELEGAPISDAGLKALTVLMAPLTPPADPQARRFPFPASWRGLTLSVASPDVTDAGMVDLASVRNLQSLRLEVPNVTEAGYARLAEAKRLTSLSLRGPAVTDAVVARLSERTTLLNLDLTGTAVTDEALTHLKKLTSLQTLALEGTQVTDAGIAQLRDLTNLQNLDLGRTAITDEGLRHLEWLTSLRRLNVTDTKVTPEAFARFERNLPSAVDRESRFGAPGSFTPRRGAAPPTRRAPGRSGDATPAPGRSAVPSP